MPHFFFRASPSGDAMTSRARWIQQAPSPEGIRRVEHVADRKAAVLHMGTDLGIRQHDDDRGRAVEGVIRGAHDGGVEPRQQSYRAGVLNGDGAWAVAVHSGGSVAAAASTSRSRFIGTCSFLKERQEVLLQRVFTVSFILVFAFQSAFEIRYREIYTILRSPGTMSSETLSSVVS